MSGLISSSRMHMQILHFDIFSEVGAVIKLHATLSAMFCLACLSNDRVLELSLGTAGLSSCELTDMHNSNKAVPQQTTLQEI